VHFVAVYDLAIHGPNGFLVEAAGNTLTAGVEARLSLGSGPKLKLTVTNSRPLPIKIGVGGGPGFSVGPFGSHEVTLDPLAKDHGWYDISLSLNGQPSWRRRFAGHLENGRPSRTR
jgi:phospholipase C